MFSEVLSDRFELKRHVGSGANGNVFQAWDRHAGAAVAVKMLGELTPRQADRFEREATILATLSHPCIVRYVAHGITPDRRPFLAMEWLEGETLESRLLRERRLSPTEAVLLGLRVSHGLSVAHRTGVVHRDIKPANLFLCGNRASEAKIADFGIARRLFDLRMVTQPGVVVGTPMYMSPEQARGESTVDARSDVFSLGCVLYESLTGEAPFAGTNIMAILAKILLEEPTAIGDLRPDLPTDLDQLLALMLAKEIDDRPSARTLVETFSSIAKRLEVLETGPLAADDASRKQTISVPPESPLGSRGEQRVLCVVLVAGPNAMSQGSATASMSDISRRVLEQAAEGEVGPHELKMILDPFGARVDRLLDGSMVVTLAGALAPTEQVVLAGRCALALRKRLPDTPIAVCTGRAVLGGRLPLGDVIDRGARLLVRAVPGSILLDDNSAGLLDGRFELTGTSGRLELGVEREIDEEPRTLLGKETPCVGRDRDLEILERVFDGCIAECAARAVLVTGPGGIGKSRLRHELVRRLRERGQRFEVLVGQGDSLRRGSPFALIAPALRGAAGIGPDDASELARAKLRARLARHLSGEPALRAAEFLGELVDLPFPDEGSPALRAARQEPRLMADQMLAAWRDWLAAETSAGPVLLVLEDVQWADLPSVEFIDAALRALGERPFMVFALARPEVFEHFPHLWRERELLALRLGGLPRRAAERLVVGALGHRIGMQRVGELVRKADGNAFYLEELIRAVATAGPDAPLPDTVLGMVQARLDALGPEAKRVLTAASIFGDEFLAPGVRVLLGGDRCPLDLDEWLSILVEREVVEAKSVHGDYAFRQALVREGAYALLTDGDRQLGHKLAGGWLERSGERRAVVLAEHFDRGGEADRAAGWYGKAALQALEANDLAGVIACADKGVGCGAVGELRGELAFVKAEAHQWRGENTEAHSFAAEALRHLPRGGGHWFRAGAALVVATDRRGQHDESARAASEMLDAAGAGGRLDSAKISALGIAAGSLVLSGRVPLADRLLRAIDAAPESLREANDVAQGAAFAARAMIAAVRADIGLLLSHTRAALASFQRAGDLRSASWQRVNEGYALLELGAYADAEATLREAIAMAEKVGAVPITSSARLNLALALLFRGSLDEAQGMLAEASRAFSAQGDMRQDGICRMYAARLLALRGDLAGAEKEARAAVDLCDALPGLKPATLAMLARILLLEQRRGEAVDASSKAMDALEKHTAIDEGESLVRVVHAEALEANGRRAEARKALASAYERLIERARCIGDHALREGFLVRVPDNARTVELAEAWGLPESTETSTSVPAAG
jgi:serine/threonine protein kinase/tetratricopeptide (TPR) repeat protein